MGVPNWVVTSVKAESDYSMKLEFADGKTGVFDATVLLEKKIYERLKNVNFFMKAEVVGDTVVWDDETDIAPEYLYENCKKI